MKSFKILDCTLRDGGYYNSWDFSNHITSEYLNSMRALDVDIIEIGLRQKQKDTYYGANAFSSDSYLSTLDLTGCFKLSVLINESELNASSLDDDLRALFPVSCTNTPISLVRIATKMDSLDNALKIASWLKSKGFDVAVNIMQVSLLSDEQVDSICSKISSTSIDILYLADSLGSLLPIHANSLFKRFINLVSIPIGFHAHDNLSLAFANFLIAIECGVEYIDATLTGMGRGPGNLRTEDVLTFVEQSSHGRYLKSQILTKVIDDIFLPLKSKHRWGTNRLYFQSALDNIHPSYVQDLQKDSRFPSEDVNSSLYLLSQNPRKSSYNPSFLDSISNAPAETTQPIRNLKDTQLRNSVFTILGPGQSLLDNHWAIELFLEKNDHVVIAVNSSANVLSALIDYRIACHPVKLINDISFHKNSPNQLILPWKHACKFYDYNAVGKLYNYDFNTSSSLLAYDSNGCMLPNPNVFLYAICAALSCGATKINLAGFDGFPLGDSRNIEMQNSILDLQKSFPSLCINSLTSTTHPIRSTSIYSLI